MRKPKVLVVFYSMTGNTIQLAKAVAEGAEKAGAEIRLRQVSELIPREKWTDQMKKVKDDLKNVLFVSKDDLKWADGIAFGSPTRYGNFSAQLKFFIDSTGDLWMSGALINKVATVFTSVSTQHGGHETTVLTAIPPLLHLGMIFIGIPYSEQRLMVVDQVSGGSPYGASSVSGPKADRSPTENELAIARTQGKRLTEISRKVMA